jgi:nitrate reductase NapAB chaperone NapD
MPHDHTLESVTKAEILDPVLREEIAALANLYDTAFRGLAAAAERARNAMIAAGRTGTADLRSFQEVFAAEVQRSLGTSLVDVSDGTREQLLRDVERSIRELPEGISVSMRFDRLDPRAIQWASTRAGTLIQQIQTETLTAVRRIIADALAGGGGVIGASSQLVRVIGLHERWQAAVDNFYENQIEDLTEMFPELGAEEIATRAQGAAEEYRARLVRTRADTIARTEIIAAQNTGQLVSWLQAADQGFLDLNNAYKEWVVGPDGWAGIAVCEICLELGGETVPVLGVFSNGEAYPPAHPNCRCNMNLIVDFGEEE